MALHISSWSPLQAAGAAMRSVSVSACRYNSTAAFNTTAPEQTGNVYQSQKPRTYREPRSYRKRMPNREKFIMDQKAQGESRALEKFQSREWKTGDVYAPKDLSTSEMKKWKTRKFPAKDAFDALDLNPLDLYKNFAIMSEFMTNMGRIKHSNTTGLRPVNQRKISKAIRRAVGLGLMPSVHRHPEILALELRSRLESGGGF